MWFISFLLISCKCHQTISCKQNIVYNILNMLEYINNILDIKKNIVNNIFNEKVNAC